MKCCSPHSGWIFYSEKKQEGSGKMNRGRVVERETEVRARGRRRGQRSRKHGYVFHSFSMSESVLCSVLGETLLTSSRQFFRVLALGFSLGVGVTCLLSDPKLQVNIL